jgi:hypothetical protein
MSATVLGGASCLSDLGMGEEVDSFEQLCGIQNVGGLRDAVVRN